MLLSDLHNKLADSIRVHHASGYFTHAEAHMRLTAQTGCTAEAADRVLAAPVDVRLFGEYGTAPPNLIRVPCQWCSQALAHRSQEAP